MYKNRNNSIDFNAQFIVIDIISLHQNIITLQEYYLGGQTLTQIFVEFNIMFFMLRITSWSRRLNVHIVSLFCSN